MTCDETTLRAFGADIQRLIDGHDLSRTRTYELFRATLLDEQPDLQQGALLAALVAKGETVAEIAGVWQAIVDFDTVPIATGTFDRDRDVTAADACEPLARPAGGPPAGPAAGPLARPPAGPPACPSAGPLVENSGTGMDALKTFNVSSAAAIIAAAAGARLARHGARALTSACGAVDILEAVGVDVECDVATVEHSIRAAGIGIFNGMSPAVHAGGLGRILSQIRFGSTLNIAASLANPVRPRHGVRGVYAGDLLAPVGEVMLEIGYEHALVVHGYDGERSAGMDELSVIGPSLVNELRADGRRDAYTVEPEDLGLRRAEHAEIAPLGDLNAEATRFVQILGGRGHEACGDAACLNAAAVLYVAGRASDLGDGLTLAREAVATGAALSKLREWVAEQAGDAVRRRAGEARLEAVLSAADLI